MKIESIVKNSIEVSPGRHLDQMVLNNSAQFFPEKENEWIKVLMPVMMFCLALVIIGKISIQNDNNMNFAKTNDSLELITHYDEIELMADASVLTDKEWEKLK